MSFDIIEVNLPVMDILLGKVTQQAMNYAIRYLQLPDFERELLLIVIDRVSRLLPAMPFVSPQDCSRYSSYDLLETPGSDFLFCRLSKVMKETNCKTCKSVSIIKLRSVPLS